MEAVINNQNAVASLTKNLEKLKKEASRCDKIRKNSKGYKFWMWAVIGWDTVISGALYIIEAGTFGGVITIPVSIFIYLFETPVTIFLTSMAKYRMNKVIDPDFGMLSVFIDLEQWLRHLMELIPIVEIAPIYSINAWQDGAKAKQSLEKANKRLVVIKEQMGMIGVRIRELKMKMIDTNVSSEESFQMQQEINALERAQVDIEEGYDEAMTKREKALSRWQDPDAIREEALKKKYDDQVAAMNK